MAAPYQHEVACVHALVQQLATSLLPNGYWFYKSGYVRDGVPIEAVDRKIIEKYGIAISPSSRTRRKAAGFANLHYLRVKGERTFLILATYGKHRFLEEESGIRDIRRDPLIVDGYSVTYKQGGFLRKVSGGEAIPDPGWHSRVQISRKRYTELKAEYLDMALRYSADAVGRRIYQIGYEPYAPVRQQLLNLLRLVNNKRKTAGMEAVAPTVIRYERRILKVFFKPTQEIAA